MRFLCSALSATSACCVMSGFVSSRRVISMRFGLRVTRAGEPADHAGERRREEQRLALLRHARDDRVDLLLEAHVEHAVGLVQHQELDAREVHAAAVHVVLEPARRGDRDVERLPQLRELQAERHAADQQRGGELLPAAVAVRRLLHLHRELARRREHQHARALARDLRRRAQPLQPRQHEGRGLAAAGLRRDQQIAARQHRGNRFALHRRRPGIAEARRGYPERDESRPSDEKLMAFPWLRQA